jgi:hypothetical protein
MQNGQRNEPRLYSGSSRNYGLCNNKVPDAQERLTYWTQGRIIGCTLRTGVRLDAGEGITLTSEEAGQDVVHC